MTVREHLLNLALAVALCVSISWLADREPPLTYHYVQALYEDAETGGVKPVPGGYVGVEFDLTRTQLCRTKAERWFRDGKGWDWDLANEELTPDLLGTYKLKKKIAIPSGVAVGMGTLKIDVFWYCNPYHTLLSWPIRETLRVPVMIEAP